MQQHNQTFSLIKAIGIISIVISHAAFNTHLSTFVYLFHISIFFFVAGYFFNDSAAARPGYAEGVRFLGDKLRRLYTPYLVIGTLFVLLHNTLLDAQIVAYNFAGRAPIEPYTTSELLHQLLRTALFVWHEQPLAAFWFLLGMFMSLIGLFVITWFCHRLSPHHPERLRGLLILCLTLVGGFLLIHPLGISEGAERLVIRCLLLLPLLYLGRLYALFERQIPLRMDLACLALLGLITATIFNYKINVGGLIFGNPFIFAILTIAGCYMLVVFAHRLSSHNNIFVRCMDYIGRNTMSIMIFHLICFKLINLVQIWVYNYPDRFLAYHTAIPYHSYLWCLPYLIVGISIPLGMAWLWDRLMITLRKIYI